MGMFKPSPRQLELIRRIAGLSTETTKLHYFTTHAAHNQGWYKVEWEYRKDRPYERSRFLGYRLTEKSLDYLRSIGEIPLSDGIDKL